MEKWYRWCWYKQAEVTLACQSLQNAWLTVLTFHMPPSSPTATPKALSY